MEKPLGIRIEELKKQLADVINSSNLHPYILDNILKDIYQEVHMVYQSQLSKELEEYNNKQKENEESTEK